jgi:hypothetical protein
MSVFTPTPDIDQRGFDVRKVPQADKAECQVTSNVTRSLFGLSHKL